MVRCMYIATQFRVGFGVFRWGTTPDGERNRKLPVEQRQTKLMKREGGGRCRRSTQAVRYKAVGKALGSTQGQIEQGAKQKGSGQKEKEEMAWDEERGRNARKTTNTKP